MKIHTKSAVSLALFLIATAAIYGSSNRTFVYTFAIILFTAWQIYFPCFKRKIEHSDNRWPINYCITFFIILITSIPTMAAAKFAESYQLGLFNQWQINSILAVVLSILILDFVFYCLHYGFHNTRLLWRFHKVHHSDLVFDTSLFGRDHLLSGVCLGTTRALFIVLLGLPIEGCVAFLLCVSLLLPFIHSNIFIPIKLDKILSILIVTPRIHYIHHSNEQSQTDTNLGVIFSFWDKIFGTYSDPYKINLDSIELGLKEYKHQEELTLTKLLKMPFSQ